MTQQFQIECGRAGRVRRQRRAGRAHYPPTAICRARAWLRTVTCDQDDRVATFGRQRQAPRCGQVVFGRAAAKFEHHDSARAAAHAVGCGAKQCRYSIQTNEREPCRVDPEFDQPRSIGPAGERVAPTVADPDHAPVLARALRRHQQCERGSRGIAGFAGIIFMHRRARRSDAYRIERAIVPRLSEASADQIWFTGTQTGKGRIGNHNSSRYVLYAGPESRNACRVKLGTIGAREPDTAKPDIAVTHTR